MSAARKNSRAACVSSRSVAVEILQRLHEARGTLQRTPDLTFVVVKINKRGRRQQRAITLSGEYLQNLRPKTSRAMLFLGRGTTTVTAMSSMTTQSAPVSPAGTTAPCPDTDDGECASSPTPLLQSPSASGVEVEMVTPGQYRSTKRLKYGDLKAIVLESPTLLRIEMVKDHNYVYDSPLAAIIHRELTRRWALFKEVRRLERLLVDQRARGAFTLSSEGSTLPVPSLSDVYAATNEAAGARSIAIMRSHSRVSMATSEPPSTDADSPFMAAIHSLPTLASSTSISFVASDGTEHRVNVQPLSRLPEAERLSMLVQRILYDPTTPEGRTRAKFLSSDFPRELNTSLAALKNEATARYARTVLQPSLDALSSSTFSPLSPRIRSRATPTRTWSFFFWRRPVARSPASPRSSPRNSVVVGGGGSGSRMRSSRSSNALPTVGEWAVSPPRPRSRSMDVSTPTPTATSGSTSTAAGTGSARGQGGRARPSLISGQDAGSSHNQHACCTVREEAAEVVVEPSKSRVWGALFADVNDGIRGSATDVVVALDTSTVEAAFTHKDPLATSASTCTYYTATEGASVHAPPWQVASTPRSTLGTSTESAELTTRPSGDSTTSSRASTTITVQDEPVGGAPDVVTHARSCHSAVAVSSPVSAAAGADESTGASVHAVFNVAASGDRPVSARLAPVTLDALLSTIAGPAHTSSLHVAAILALRDAIDLLVAHLLSRRRGLLDSVRGSLPYGDGSDGVDVPAGMESEESQAAVSDVSTMRSEDGMGALHSDTVTGVGPDAVPIRAAAAEAVGGRRTATTATTTTAITATTATTTSVEEGVCAGRSDTDTLSSLVATMVESFEEPLTVARIVAREVEVAFFNVFHIRTGIASVVNLLVDAAAMSELQQRMARLRAQPQEFFGVSEKLRRGDGWAAAVHELRAAETHTAPADKLAAILASARAVYVAYAQQEAEVYLTQVARGLPPPAIEPLGADEFFPVYVYVLVQAHLVQPLHLKELLWLAADPQDLRGQSGYWLTVYEAALQFICTVPLPEALLVASSP